MARQPRTPGATNETPKTTETAVATSTTADQADAALDAILGTPDSESTSTPSEPEPTTAELLEIINGLKSKIANQASAPVAQHVPASGVGSEPVAKRTRQVLTDKGWDSEEY